MSTLSLKGRDLIRAGRRAYQPTISDRERIHSALQARLGANVLPPDLGAAATVASASRTLWWLIPAVVVGVGIVGGALFLARAPTARQPASPVAVATPVAVKPEPRAVPVPVVVPPAGAPKKLSDSPSRQNSILYHKRQDQLAAEVAILSRATHDLRAGHPAEALIALDEYCRKFPKGLLNEEQQAARAQSLCGLGRFDEAKTKIARLSRQSPLAIRARQFCDAKFAAR